MTEPPNDPWENAPRMSPEQGPPPPQPGQWGAPPGQQGPPPGQWGQPPQGPPPGQWGQPPQGPPPGPPQGQWGQPPAPYGQPAYGAPHGYAPPGYAAFGQAPKNGLGIGALICGIVGIFLSFIVIGGILGAVAILLGILGLGRVKRNEANNRGVAIGGIATGGVAVLAAMLFLVVYIALSDEIGSYADCVAQAETQTELDQCSRDFEQNLEQ